MGRGRGEQKGAVASVHEQQSNSETSDEAVGMLQLIYFQAYFMPARSQGSQT